MEKYGIRFHIFPKNVFVANISKNFGDVQYKFYDKWY